MVPRSVRAMALPLATLLAVLGAPPPALAAPLDPLDPLDPLGGAVRVELPVYEPLSPYAPHALDAGAAYYSYLPLAADAAAGQAQESGLVGSIVAQRAHAAAQLHAKSGLFSAPVTKLESAILQTEGFESKPLTVKENLQNIVAGIFQPKPIVDTISEVDKYGNSGDKFAAAGRALVGGAEGISNLVNKALDIPGVIFKKITRTASEKLNNFGGRLIGLV